MWGRGTGNEIKWVLVENIKPVVVRNFFFKTLQVYTCCYFLTFKYYFEFLSNFLNFIVMLYYIRLFFIWNNEMTNSSLLITFSLFNFFSLFVSSRWGRRQVYLSYLNIFTLRWKIFCKFCLLFQVLPRTLKTSFNIAVFSVVQQGFSYWLIFCKLPEA